MQDSQILLSVVRQNFASVVWTHKIQEKQADIYSERYKLLETINVVIAALISCGLVSLYSEQDYILVKFGTCILSFVSLAITAYFKSFDLKTMEKLHKDAANKFIVIRNDLLQVIADIIMESDSVENLRKSYDCIMNRLNALYVELPETSPKAVKRASEALKIDKEYTYTEGEIDRFLPPVLRGFL